MYTLFNILDLVVRQSGTNAESKQLRDILLSLRDSKSAESDWKTTLQRTPLNAKNANEFTNAPH